jgi:hypothetical protein
MHKLTIVGVCPFRAHNEAGSALMLTFNDPPLKLPITTLEKSLGDYLLDVDQTGTTNRVTLSIDLCGDRLCASAEGDAPVVLWPRGARTFYHYASDFQIDFIGRPDGSVSGCLITLSGAEVRGERVMGAGLSTPD